MLYHGTTGMTLLGLVDRPICYGRPSYVMVDRPICYGRPSYLMVDRPILW